MSKRRRVAGEGGPEKSRDRSFRSFMGSFRVTKENSFGLVFSLLLVTLMALFLASFFIGRYSIPLKELMDILLSPFLKTTPYWEATHQTVMLEVRFPRIMLAILAGGALSLSGVSYQTLFKNPMASPDLLGVSSGAGFGAALAMLLAGSWWQIQIFAFVSGIIAVGLAFVIGSRFVRSSTTTLILAGIAVSGMFNALLSIVKIKADTDSVLPSITFWLMGSLGRADKGDVLFLLIPVALSLVFLYMFRHSINALAAGDESAKTLGVNVQLTKIVVIVCATFMTVSAVSVCGIIGWIGVIIPHVARMMVGASFPKCAAVTFLTGGIFLLGIDNLVRGVEGAELPLGVLTSLAGTPIFLLLLARRAPR